MEHHRTAPNGDHGNMPQVAVHCTNMECPRLGKTTVVDVGFLVAEGVMYKFDTHTCTSCLFPMTYNDPTNSSPVSGE